MIFGTQQSVERNSEAGFQLLRIGDAVSARNIRAAIFDALWLVRYL